MDKVKNRFKEGMVININAESVFGAQRNPKWTEGRVVDILDSQFTAHIPSYTETGEYRIVYRMYTELGRTWNFIDG
jgi:hypothetical protein